MAPVNHHMLLAYSDEVFWNIGPCVGIALHLLGVSALLRNLPVTQVTGRIGNSIKFLAGGSFSVYVLHYPILHLLDALFDTNMRFAGLFLLLLTLLSCYIFAGLFERPLL